MSQELKFIGPAFGPPRRHMLPLGGMTSWSEPNVTGCRLKAARGGELLQALQWESMQFRLDGRLVTPSAAQSETDDLGNKWSVVYCEAVAEIPLRFSVLAGDLVHNLRTALDHLVYQLVLLDKGEPTRKTAWPVFSEKPVGPALKRYNAALKGIKNQDVVGMLDWFQPYQTPSNPLRENLALLAEVDNIDKHRLVRPGVAIFADLQNASGAMIVPGEVNVGRELFRVPESTGLPVAAFLYELAFWEQQVTVEQLSGFVETVQGIIEKFAPFFLSDA